MGKSIIRIVLLACFILPIQQVYAQSGVGIGTSNPNPNAALDITSAANDKGILVPRLTSTQRLAMNASLSATENGLLVFDSDLKEFFYWNNTIWVTISVIQDLQLVGNSLSITKNSSATVIDLSPFSGTNTDNQDLSSSSSGNNRTVDITGGTSTTFNVADNDNSSTNEIQTIAKVGSTVTLSNGGGSFSVNDGDISSTNEIQSLSNTAAGTNRTVNISGGTGTTFSIADNDNSATNEIQDLSTTAAGTNRNINITSGKGITISVADNDNSSANEIQTLTFSSPNLSISGGNSVAIPNTFQDAFRAFFSKTNSFLKGTFKIPFDITEYDLNGSYKNASGDYVVPVDGIYRIAGMVSVLPQAIFPINILIQVNGVAIYQQEAFPSNASDGQFVSYLFDTETRIAKGDVVEFFINSSGGFTLNGGNTISYITGRLVVQL